MLNKKYNLLAILALLMLSFNAYATNSTWSTQTWSTMTWTTTEVMTTSTTISWIDFVDSQTLSVKLSNTLSWISLDSQAKVLEDIKVLSSEKDTTDVKKIKLQLENDLVDGNDYSIISVSEWLDTSIDFNLSGDKSKIVNTALMWAETWIEYISVLDSKTIEIHLNKDLPQGTFEFKVFKEVTASDLFLDVSNLNVKFANPLLSSKDYILILTLKDSENKDIEIENSLYDFTTPEFATEVEQIPEMLASTWAVSETSTWEVTQSWVAIEDAAKEVTQTPPTWAKTNILLFLTFILTVAFVLLRKESSKA